MHNTLSASQADARRQASPKPHASPGLHRVRRSRTGARQRKPLAHYTDRHGRSRELIARPTIAGSLLVLDRDAASGGDELLIAHLAVAEPIENATLVCSAYLEDLHYRQCVCRRLGDGDLGSELIAEGEPQPMGRCEEEQACRLLDPRARCHVLEPVWSGMLIPELRWCWLDTRSGSLEAKPVSTREVIARLESYEPVRELTLRSLARHHGDNTISTTALRAELARVQESPIVLNRRLREVVLATVERDGLSMSQIAMRCGRLKRDRRGNQSGETSWLARRLGLLAEGGQRGTTPWIHSDVLALIARRGLGMSPREVEVP